MVRDPARQVRLLQPFEIGAAVNSFERLLQCAIGSRDFIHVEELSYLSRGIGIAEASCAINNGRAGPRRGLSDDLVPVITHKVPSNLFAGFVLHDRTDEKCAVLVSNLTGDAQLQRTPDQRRIAE